MDAQPAIVSPDEWTRARSDLLRAEKEATRAFDALAAQRRRLPMVRFSSDAYTFVAPDGSYSLVDLFGEHSQLIVYQFMDRGPDEFCGGCTAFTNNIPGIGDLADAGVSWWNVSNMPLAQIEAYKAQMGWSVPFASSRGTTFAADCGADDGFMLSVFLRDGSDVFRTYATTARGVDRLLFTNNMLDLTPFGRQEDWEDSPPGWPQHPTYG